MRKVAHVLTIFALAIFSTYNLSAQCVPDTTDCLDNGGPIKICPATLPELTVNIAYDEAITVVPPGKFDYPGVGMINISYIVIDSLINLPPGLEFQANASQFYPDTAYCIQISGTPSEAGDFPLSIYVTAVVDFGAGPVGAQIVDDTSVVLTVQGPSGIDPNQVYEFRVLPNAPNPFTDITRLGFFTPFDDRVELKVYNILGEMMHQELEGASPGEHFFQFDGEELIPGTYFYRITNSSSFYTGKFIKTR